jgi:DNA-binding CsgD family transcriptional regulator/PAS domain-containing protein
LQQQICLVFGDVSSSPDAGRKRAPLCGGGRIAQKGDNGPREPKQITLWFPKFHSPAGRLVGQMSEDDDLSSVVGRIYDAVLNPALWNDALERIARFVGGPAGALGFEDLVARFASAGHDVGLDLEYMQMHSELYGGFDPFTSVSLLDVDEVVSLLELMPHHEDCVRRFAHESAQTHGDVGVTVDRSDSHHGPIAAEQCKANATIDDDMRRRMSLVAPHLRRAIVIGKAIGRKFSEASTFASILDRLSAGLFLIDTDGRIAYANAAGRGILHSDDFLRSLNGRLVARDADVNRTLQAAFAPRSDREIDRKGIALPLIAQNRECHVVHVLPRAIASGIGAGRPGAVAAAVFVCKARLEIPSAPEVIQRAYQLTPAELRVLLAIVNIGGISEVATSFGVANSTVKTHVRRLFEKTGTARQADLVKLVVGFCPLLVA